MFLLEIVILWMDFFEEVAKVFRGKRGILLIIPFRINGCAEILLSFLQKKKKKKIEIG